jgi:hypothetical protein
MPASGFFDFCIKQFPENAVPSSNQSRITVTSAGSGNRYLKNKYMLVRDNISQHSSDFLHPRDSEAKSPSIINSNLYVSNAK